MGEVLVERQQRTLLGKHNAEKSLGVRAGFATAGSTTFDALAQAFRGIVERRRLKKLLTRTGEAVPLSAVSDGVVRVEGRVEILEAVTHRDDGPLAAFAWRGAGDGVCGCNVNCKAMVRVIETRRAAGRFLVRDAGGVALVAGPWIRLLDYSGRGLEPESGELYVREGDTVAVVGKVRLESVDDPRARLLDGYRGVKKTPVFLGEEGAAVHVFCKPVPRTRSLGPS